MQDSNTIQLQMYANGDFALIWRSGVADDGVTGYSSGNNVPDPGSIDFTAVIPRTFGPYGVPLGLDSTRPVLGSTAVYSLRNVPPNTTLGAIIFGSAATSTPLDPIGMAACTLLTSGDLASAPVTPANPTFSLRIPNQPNLIGASLFQQGFAIAPGVNAFGVAASNGLELSLGR